MFAEVDLQRTYTEIEVQKIWGISKFRLRNERRNGTGPEILKIGRSVRYRGIAIEEWLAACTRTPSIQHPKAGATT